MSLAARASSPQPVYSVATPETTGDSGALAQFVGRQAIFDRDLRVKAYELLYRGERLGDGSVLDGTHATADVLATSLVDIGLSKLVGTKPVYLNVGREFLLDTSALPVDPANVVLEILEDVRVDETLIHAVAQLSAAGFTLALDDYDGGDNWAPLLPYVSIIKFDVRAMDPRAIAAHIERLRPRNLTLLAEKVETQEEFEFYKTAGIDLFQGYFLARPKVVSGRRLPATRRNLLQLLAAVRNPETNTTDLVSLIEQDVGLSFRLLRFLNSATFGMPREVTSIERSVVLLGLEGLRSWASLICLAGGEVSSSELIRLSLCRAKTCELLQESVDPSLASAAFTAGMFSNLDAFMQAPLPELLDEIRLAAEIRDALLDGNGPLAAAVKCALACERCDWDEARGSGFQPTQIGAAFREANCWSDDLLSQLELA